MSIRGTIFKTKAIRTGKRIGKLLAAGLALVCIVGALQVPAAYAAETNQVTLPVSQVFTAYGSTPPDKTFTYRLTSETAYGPLPAGSDSAGYTFTIKGTAKAQIGPIDYGDVGIYTYTLACASNAATNYTIDRQVYTITVYVLNNSTPITVVYLSDGDKTSEISFAQVYGNATSPVLKQWIVTFMDGTGTTLETEKVKDGGAATAPSDPKRAGYVFAGWDKSYSDITSDLIVTAKWVPWRGGPSPTPSTPAPMPTLGSVTPANPPVSQITPAAPAQSETQMPAASITPSAMPQAPGFAPTAPGHVWSLLSCMMSVAAALTALLLLVFIYFRKKEYEKYTDDLDDQGLLTDNRQNELDDLRKKGRILKVFAVIAGILTPIVWLILDLPLVGMIWIDRSTPWVGLVFIVTMILVIAFNIRKKHPEDEDADEDELNPTYAK